MLDDMKYCPYCGKSQDVRIDNRSIRMSHQLEKIPVNPSGQEAEGNTAVERQMNQVQPENEGRAEWGDTAERCPGCSAPVSSEQKFCLYCGMKLRKSDIVSGNGYTNHTQQQSGSPYDSTIFADMVWKNVFYYQNVFKTMNCTGSIVSWNWCAFLVAPCWLFYRKISGWGIGYLVVWMLFQICGMMPIDNGGFVTFLNFLFWVFQIAFPLLMGMFGNYLYKEKLDPILQKFYYARKEGKEYDSYVSACIESQTGVSGGNVVLYFVISIMFEIIIFIWMIYGF